MLTGLVPEVTANEDWNNYSNNRYEWGMLLIKDKMFHKRQEVILNSLHQCISSTSAGFVNMET